MAQIMTVKQVISRGLWRSKKIIHCFTEPSFRMPAHGNKCFFGLQCAMWQCNYIVWSLQKLASKLLRSWFGLSGHVTSLATEKWAGFVRGGIGRGVICTVCNVEAGPFSICQYLNNDKTNSWYNLAICCIALVNELAILEAKLSQINVTTHSGLITSKEDL